MALVLGHDATHGSLVAAPLHNRVLARLLFLPALHNYTLWRIEHNRLHHRSPSVRGINSWGRCRRRNSVRCLDGAKHSSGFTAAADSGSTP